jgi:putative transposase
VLQAYRYALDPAPAQARALASHCGAARKAFNEGLAQVKRCLAQRDAERSYGVPDGQLTPVPWMLPALRRWWNASKDQLAPWWPDNSKEAYNSGLDALARGLKAFSDSRAGKRRGPKVAFPRFKSRRRGRPTCRFTTGAIRVEGRSHVVLPRIGRVKTHEPVTVLLAKVAAGQARVLAATVSFDGRRWYCSFTVEAGRAPGRPAHVGADRAHPVIGVDAGVRDLLVAAAPDGTEVARVPAPRSLARAQGRLRAAQRQAARQDGPDRRTGQQPSRRWRRTSAADRAHPRPGREPAPRRAAQGHHRARPAARGDRDRGPRREEHDPPQARCRPGRARAEPGPGRRRPRRAAPPARLQDHLVRLGPARRGPVVSQLEDLFGLRPAKAKPDPGRTDLGV